MPNNRTPDVPDPREPVFFPLPPGDQWRVLLSDRSDPADPRWLLCTVGAVRAMETDETGRQYADWPATSEWVRQLCGWLQLSLSPIEVVGWRADEGLPR